MSLHLPIDPPPELDEIPHANSSMSHPCNKISVVFLFPSFISSLPSESCIAEQGRTDTEARWSILGLVFDISFGRRFYPPLCSMSTLILLVSPLSLNRWRSCLDTLLGEILVLYLMNAMFFCFFSSLWFLEQRVGFCNANK